jgi:muramoyltetrapeptide carboxypeptidase
MKLPPFLKKSDPVALVATSGPLPEGRLEQAVESVRELGLEPIVYRSCQLKHGYFAGNDEDRARCLQASFDDPDSKAVISIRGGYGAHRLWKLVDYDAIAASGKGYYGYSDITAVHMELNRRGLVTWHSPMPSTEWYKGLDDYTLESLKRALFGPLPDWLENPPDVPMETVVPGKAIGMLTGGNMSLVASTLGTPYELDTKGKILFLEDVDEPPYRIDRMLLQLSHAGKLDDCAGVILGPFVDSVPSNPNATLTLEEIIDELLGGLGKPVIKGFQCGHSLPTMSIPLGAQVLLDADNGIVQVLGV